MLSFENVLCEEDMVQRINPCPKSKVAKYFKTLRLIVNINLRIALLL